MTAAAAAAIWCAQTSTTFARAAVDEPVMTHRSEGSTAGRELLAAAGKGGVDGLSARAHRLAEQLGLASRLAQLDYEPPSADIASRVRSLEDRQELMETLLQVMLEVRTAEASVNAEIARADDLHARLEHRRDRALRLTTMANLITGAFNGIGGNSMEIARPLELPARIMDIVEGATQTGLAGLSLAEQRGEQRESSGLGKLLSQIFDLSAPNTVFPDSVWNYLNSAQPDTPAGLSRRAAMVDRWMKMGIARRRSKSNWEHRITHITGRAQGSDLKVTLSVLEDRDAMLRDLRSLIEEMDSGLLEIVRLIRTRR